MKLRNPYSIAAASLGLGLYALYAANRPSDVTFTPDPGATSVSLPLIPARAHHGRCTGAFPCTACVNCTACIHCAQQGGTCGVCSR